MKQEICPSVFAVGDRYQICVPLEINATVCVTIGDDIYRDEVNGVLRSNTWFHKIEVPMRALDAARAYTVVCTEIKERKPYFTVGEEPFSQTFPFMPFDGERVRIYHISDTHCQIDGPVELGRAYADETDILILNGDISNHSSRVENLQAIYRIAYGVTKGEKPVVFSRGNHDNRGVLAEDFTRFTPTDNGRPYYTFRLGPLWGMVLDCGEDKADDNVEYGPTVCFHEYRKRVTAFLDGVIGRAEDEYAAPGVKRRLLICHVPFFMRREPPFNIEEDVYGYWLRRVKEDVRPDLILCGHTHSPRRFMPGEKDDLLGELPCPAFVASGINYDKKEYTAGWIDLREDDVQIKFDTVRYT